MSDAQTTHELMTRGHFLKKSAVLALGLSTTASLIESLPAIAGTAKRRIEAAYLPTWLENTEYTAIAQRLNLKNLNRVMISFATADTSGELQLPPIKPSLHKLIGSLGAGTELMLAIGGEIANPAGWAEALAKPQEFASQSSNALTQMRKTTGREFTGIDLDFEFPNAFQALHLVGLVKELRQTLPNQKITMTLPPTDYNLEGFLLTKHGLNPLVDNFNVMSYNYNGPWEKTATDIASGPLIAQSIDQMVGAIGDQSKVVVGLPAYGFEYPKAKHRGDSFKQPRGDGTILYDAIPQASIKDNMHNLTSEAKADGNWVSCLSPRVIHQIIQDLYHSHPNLGGAFYWDMDGMTQADISAISQ